DPPVKPPPWIHTITGKSAPGSAPAGFHKLRYRQSSEEPSDTDPGAPPHPAWAQVGPNSLPSRTPSQAATGCGGRHRNAPTGGAAYGLPLKLETSPPVVPPTIPEAVRTVCASAW